MGKPQVELITISIRYYTYSAINCQVLFKRSTVDNNQFITYNAAIPKTGM